mgnify:CR=1 FL=1
MTAQNPQTKDKKKAPRKKVAKKTMRKKRPVLKKKIQKKRANKNAAISRLYTIHLHKRLHGLSFKQRAPRAVKEIKQFAQKAMGTADCRLDVRLNKFLWSRGIRNVPTRVRVKMSRKRNEDEDAKEKMYTLVEHVPVPSFDGLQTVTVDE